MNRSRTRNAAAYGLLLLVFGAGLWVILKIGAGLPPSIGEIPPPPPATTAAGAGLFSSPFPLLLLQILVIVAASRICAAGARRMGQPEVVGEIAAGILLGPSLLGWVWPASGAFLFAPQSLASLNLLSQLGLVIFMFIVGTEMNHEVLRREAHAALLISHASVAAPFLMGAGLALYLYRDFAPAGVAFHSFALFLGTAMSITAFPVLARIIRETGLQQTRLGTLTLACAAVDDATAWCALAAVVGIVREGSAAGAGRVILLCALFSFLMLGVLRPWLKRRAADRAAPANSAPAALMIAFASALITEKIGVHALFGAFLAGMTMPEEGDFRRDLAGRVQSLASLILLPIFFALTGLRTQVGLLQTPGAWAACGLIVLTAVAGKIGGGAAAARLTGLGRREALAVGVLMNARGLVELVVLNIGFDLGILTPGLFTMMVLMALGTTLMTGPLVKAVLGRGS